MTLATVPLVAVKLLVETPVTASLKVAVKLIGPLVTAAATLSVTATTVGKVARVNVTGVLAPVLPAASVSWATMLWMPLPDSVTLVNQLPPGPTAAVPSWVVTPFKVSNNVTVDPTAASPADAATVPDIVCVAWLVEPPGLAMATVGATV